MHGLGYIGIMATYSRDVTTIFASAKVHIKARKYCKDLILRMIDVFGIDLSRQSLKDKFSSLVSRFVAGTKYVTWLLPSHIRPRKLGDDDYKCTSSSVGTRGLGKATDNIVTRAISGVTDDYGRNINDE